MSLDNVQLSKLLKFFMLKENLRTTQIRNDARELMKRQDEGASGGGHFHLPFWKAAKDHAAGRDDLQIAIASAINDNWRRERLYPQLRDGFLSWWTGERRWINEPITEVPTTIKSSFGFVEIDGRVKVDNFLSLRIGEDRNLYIYPYFSYQPELTPEFARLGLWLIGKALPEYRLTEIRILDVIRGRPFSVEQNPLRGDEEEEFSLRYRSILREWRSELR